MDPQSLQAILLHWLQANNYAFQDREKLQPLEADQVVWLRGTTWCLYLMDGRPREGGAIYRSFDRAVGRAIQDARSAPPGCRLALCVPLPPAGERLPPNLLRALKKYSNSIVFEDLQLSLWLVFDRKKVEIIAPGSVNAFLRAPQEAITSFRNPLQDATG